MFYHSKNAFATTWASWPAYITYSVHNMFPSQYHPHLPVTYFAITPLKSNNHSIIHVYMTYLYMYVCIVCVCAYVCVQGWEVRIIYLLTWYCMSLILKLIIYTVARFMCHIQSNHVLIDLCIVLHHSINYIIFLPWNKLIMVSKIMLSH